MSQSQCCSLPPLKQKLWIPDCNLSWNLPLSQTAAHTWNIRAPNHAVQREPRVSQTGLLPSSKKEWPPPSQPTWAWHYIVLNTPLASFGSAVPAVPSSPSYLWKLTLSQPTQHTIKLSLSQPMGFCTLILPILLAIPLGGSKWEAMWCLVARWG